MKIVNSFFLVFVLLLGCQTPKEKAEKDEKFQWNAGISAPKNYISTPFVEYFYQGKSIAGTSANVGIEPGWGINSGGYTEGDKFKSVPDSIYVKWRCGFDLISYEGGSKLPRKKMLNFFKKGVLNTYTDKKEDYTILLTGTAPGGNSTIWMKAGPVITEVLKFKAKKIKQEDRYAPHTITLWTSTGQEAKDILTYINLHGVPYRVWEKGEKEYNYDIAFSSEDESKKNYSIAIAGYTKDGSLVYSNHDPIPFVNWSQNINLEVKENKKLPVQLWIRWHSQDGNEWYESQVVLPTSFENTVVEFQKHNGKNIFMIIGMDKVERDKSYTFGKIWLENSNKKETIMVFRASKFNLKLNDFEVSKYSLPKGFVFPKWEGREPLIKPTDFEYWQEK